MMEHRDYEDKFQMILIEKDKHRNDAKDQFEARAKLEKHLSNF